jgi:hypothetical protein
VFIYGISRRDRLSMISRKRACCAIAMPQVEQVKNAPLDSKPVSSHRGQAGVPRTQDGRVVIGTIDIEDLAETAACPAERDGLLVGPRNGDE